MSRYDADILGCIEKSFKTPAEIAAETSISRPRVDARLSFLRKTKQVICVREMRGSKKGVRPMKYRKSPVFQ